MGLGETVLLRSLSIGLHTVLETDVPWGLNRGSRFLTQTKPSISFLFSIKTGEGSLTNGCSGTGVLCPDYRRDDHKRFQRTQKT